MRDHLPMPYSPKMRPFPKGIPWHHPNLLRVAGIAEKLSLRGFPRVKIAPVAGRIK